MPRTPVGQSSAGFSFLSLPPKDDGTSTPTYFPAGDYYFGNFTVKGDVIIDGSAKIVVTGDLKIESLGKITINGSVEFYVAGTSYLAGQGVVNTSQDPRNLVIYSTGPSMYWAATSDFYGYLYGPQDSVITIEGAADYYGGAIGRELYLAGEGDIHTEIGKGFDGPNYKYPILVD